VSAAPRLLKRNRTGENLTGQINLDQHLDVEDTSGKVVHCLHFEDAVDVARGLTHKTETNLGFNHCNNIAGQTMGYPAAEGQRVPVQIGKPCTP
jgi:hypothetical protein